MPIELRDLTPLLQVFDMPTSIRFYRDLLGFEVVSSSPLVHGKQGEYFHWAMLRRNNVTLMLNTAYDEGERPDSPDPARVAAHGDTCLFFGCPDVDGTYNYLRSVGVEAEGPTITRYGMKQFVVADPDGYQLSFQWPVGIR
jgi:glyoxylase I family protein